MILSALRAVQGELLRENALECTTKETNNRVVSLIIGHTSHLSNHQYTTGHSPLQTDLDCLP